MVGTLFSLFLFLIYASKCLDEQLALLWIPVSHLSILLTLACLVTFLVIVDPAGWTQNLRTGRVNLDYDWVDFGLGFGQAIILSGGSYICLTYLGPANILGRPSTEWSLVLSLFILVDFFGKSGIYYLLGKYLGPQA